jgi:hypothetical protein
MNKVTKRFDKTLFDENDAICRKKVKSLFRKSGLKILDNTERYGVDLLIQKDGVHVGNIELERRKGTFENGKFKYDTINYPSRKEKFLDLGLPTYFISFSEDMKNYLVVKAKDIRSSPKEEVRNKYVYTNEQFYKVKISKAVQDDITIIIQELMK